MFIKLFTQILDSSIADNRRLRHFFTDLMLCADAKGYVVMTKSAIARRIGCSFDEVDWGIQELMKPDPLSKTAEGNGARIEELEGQGYGWRVINYEAYRAMRDADQLREATKARVRRHRENKKDVTHVTLGNAITEAEAEAEADILKLNTCATISDSDTIPKEKKTRFTKPTRDQIIEYGKTLNPIFANADRFIDYYEANGWKVGKSPMKSWQAAVRNWNSKAKPESRPTTEKTNYQKNGLKHRPFD